MKKTSLAIAALLISFAAFTAFSSGVITIGDIASTWIRPSDIETGSGPWIFPDMYETASDTSNVGVYDENRSDSGGPENILGFRASKGPMGIDYLNASVRTAYSAFGINRLILRTLFDHLEFDMRYMSMNEGTRNYFDEIGLDITALDNMVPPAKRRKGEGMYFYLKLSNALAAVKPGYPDTLSWEPIRSIDPLFRTIMIFREFALTFGCHLAMRKLNFLSRNYDLSLEAFYKPFDPVVVRAGIVFPEGGGYDGNVGASFSCGDLNFNVGYEFGSYADFAASAGEKF